MMARHDLAKMSQGIMEVAGECATLTARDHAVCAVLFSLLLLVLWGVYWFLDDNWLWAVRLLVDGVPDK